MATSAMAGIFQAGRARHGPGAGAEVGRAKHGVFVFGGGGGQGAGEGGNVGDVLGVPGTAQGTAAGKPGMRAARGGRRGGERRTCWRGRAWHARLLAVESGCAWQLAELPGRRRVLPGPALTTAHGPHPEQAPLTQPGLGRGSCPSPAAPRWAANRGRHPAVFRGARVCLLQPRLRRGRQTAWGARDGRGKGGARLAGPKRLS